MWVLVLDLVVAKRGPERVALFPENVWIFFKISHSKLTYITLFKDMSNIIILIPIRFILD